VSGRVSSGARSGPPCYLNDQEEKELVNFLIGCSKIGFAKSREEVLAIVQSLVAKKQGKDPEEVLVTTGWWNSFRKRHPQLTVRVASRLSYVRAVAHDPEIFQGYFERHCLVTSCLNCCSFLCNFFCGCCCSTDCDTQEA